MPTPRKGAQIPIRKRGQEKCPHHRNQEVVFCCKKCDGVLLCVDCAETNHRGHPLDKILEIIAEKKDYLQEFIRRYEQYDLANLEHDIDDISDKIESNAKYFSETIDEIHKRGCELRRVVDKVTRDRIMECKQLESENLTLLQNHRDELLQLHELLNDKLQECKLALKSENNVLILESEREISFLSNRPQCPDLQSATFNEGNDMEDELQSGFGSLCIQGGRRISEFDFTQVIHSVCPTPKGCWISNRLGKTATLLNQQGHVKQKVDTGSFVTDISVSPLTGNIWISCENCTVYELLGNTLSKRFATDHFPCCICVAMDDTVIVSTEHRITLQTVTGPLQYRNYKDAVGKYLLVGPYHVSVCPVTAYIAVCTRDYATGGGKNRPHIVMFDPHLHLRYRYYGPNPRHQPVINDHLALDPFDVSFDYWGNLFIADFRSKCIHLISGYDGVYLRSIPTDEDSPLALGLLNDNVLWVAHGNKKVKVIKAHLNDTHVNERLV